MFSADRCSAVLAAVRARAPLVHNITNYVVMNNTANALLALGETPAHRVAAAGLRQSLTLVLH